MEDHPSVDCVVKPGDNLPFDDASFDLIVSTSCFEHDPCFWLTFKEMSRIIKPTGYIYINAPSGGHYHCYPGDNWRFYPDAGQALAYWSGKQIATEDIFPLKVVETFLIDCPWRDFICIWKRVNIEDKEETITTHPDIRNNIGRIEAGIHTRGLNTIKTGSASFP
jgi:SAM-dependent methyltransferase